MTTKLCKIPAIWSVTLLSYEYIPAYPNRDKHVRQTGSNAAFTSFKVQD